MEDLISIKNRFDIIGNSESLENALRVAIQVAPTDMSVLIVGESGTGKESFSKIIHQLSARKHKNFVAINCGAIPEGTIDSELFGHEKGAFTGALEARKGYFEEVNGGTIFLDEIGEMPLATQARLLRILENGEYIRVGSSKAQKVDVRVVAATNVNLKDAIMKRKFREDLYFRLNTVPILVPPLRERGQDIDLLFRKFAGDYAQKYKMPTLKLTPDAVELLLKCRFSGNVRQLKNLVDQISVMEKNRSITADILQKYLRDTDFSTPPALLPNSGDSGSGSWERDMFVKVIFKLKEDVEELKKAVSLLLKGDLGAEAMNTYSNVLNHGFDAPNSSTFLLEAGSKDQFKEHSSGSLSAPQTIEIKNNPIEEDERDSLSWENHERELIVRALKKHRNRRRNAALDLGMSERTLYRKIKQYNLENIKKK